MAYKILVNGLLTYDSGKTWFVIGLAKALLNKGYEVCVYKPIAGHNGWLQFNTIRESLRKKILMGEDVINFFKYNVVKDNISLINPVDFLLVPPDINKFSDINQYLNTLEDQYKESLLIRISDYKVDSTRYFKIVDNIKYIMSSLRRWIDKLTDVFRPINISLREFLKIFLSRDIDRILNYNLDVMNKKYDYVIIESFNNVSIPYKDLINYVDKIISITHGYSILPDSIKALEELKNNFSRYLTTDQLINEIGYNSVRELPAAVNPRDLSKYIMKNLSIFLY